MTVLLCFGAAYEYHSSESRPVPLSLRASLGKTEHVSSYSIRYCAPRICMRVEIYD